MNNLKRVLSLALASVMLIGMMAVGASAADFSDNAEIENKEAVDTMVALKIIGGYPDGSYKPEGLLTRAEAAKMIFVALNGGKESDNLTTKTVPTFSDIKGNWAEGYIEWAAADKQGIIAGYPEDNTFRPNGNLTGTQLAKMMLVAIGYNAKSEGLEGTNDWALNTNSLALGNGFFEGLDDLDPEAFITRDQAALLILNACQAPMVKYSSYLQTNNGTLSSTLVAEEYDDHRTILTSKYELYTKYGYMTAATYDSTNKVYKYTIGDTNADSDAFITTAGDLTASGVKTGGAYQDGQITATQDFSELWGQKVKVLYKKNSANEVVLYGLTSEAKLIAEGAWGDATDATTTFKFGGKTYNKNQDSTVNFLNAGNTAADAWTTFKAYDNDGDGKIDVIITYPYLIGKVSYVGSTTFNVDAPVSKTGVTKSKVTVYSDIAKNDIVKYTAKANDINGKDIYTKFDVTVEGKIEALKGSTANGDAELKVDGTWYSYTDDGNAYAVGDSWKFYVDNGWVAYASAVDTSSTITYALVIGKGTTVDGDLVKLLFPDGSESTVTMARYCEDGGDFDDDKGIDDVDVGTLVKYEINTKGAYDLIKAEDTEEATVADAKTKSGYEHILGTRTYDYVTGGKSTVADGSGNEIIVADDAVVFVQDSTGKNFSVITGAQMKKYPDASDPAAGIATVDYAYANTDKTTKYESVALAKVTLQDSAEAAAVNYGFVTSDLVEIANPNGSSPKTVSQFTFWTVDGEVKDAVATAELSSTVEAGSVIKYSLNDNGSYTVEAASVSVGAISKWDAKTGSIEISSKDGTAISTAAVDKDTVVLYINSNTPAGVEGGEIALAARNSDDTAYLNNVYFVETTSTAMGLLVVDTYANLASQRVAGSEVELTSAGDADKDQADVVAALAANETVILNAAKITEAVEVTVEDGQTLSIYGTAAKGITVNAEPGATVKYHATTKGSVAEVVGANTLSSNDNLVVTIAESGTNVVITAADESTVTVNGPLVSAAALKYVFTGATVVAKSGAENTATIKFTTGNITGLTIYTAAGDTETAGTTAAPTNDKTYKYSTVYTGTTTITATKGWLVQGE